ncbi:4Fe-4S dicluster domain-containing protein [Planctomycetota bacterium]
MPNRREFIGSVFKTLGAGAAVLYGLGSLTALGGKESGKTAVVPIGRFAIDYSKCIGCGSCVRACREENDIPPGFTRTWIERYQVGTGGEVSINSPEAGEFGFPPTAEPEVHGRTFFVPKLCNQCSNPPCVAACPVHATFISPGGFVLIDTKLCIGCSYCILACPYGARYRRPDLGTADMCNWCYHRIAQDLEPLCVEVCHAGARQWIAPGTSENPGSQKQARPLRPGTETKPKVLYYNLDPVVR